MLPLFLLLQGCVIKEKRSANDSEAIKSFFFVPFCRAKQSPANPSCTSSWKTKRKKRERERERKKDAKSSFVPNALTQIRWRKEEGGSCKKSKQPLFFPLSFFLSLFSGFHTFFLGKGKTRETKSLMDPKYLLGKSLVYDERTDYFQ